MKQTETNKILDTLYTGDIERIKAHAEQQAQKKAECLGEPANIYNVLFYSICEAYIMGFMRGTKKKKQSGVAQMRELDSTIIRKHNNADTNQRKLLALYIIITQYLKEHKNEQAKALLDEINEAITNDTATPDYLEKSVCKMADIIGADVLQAYQDQITAG